jgi:hypothetical protein
MKVSEAYDLLSDQVEVKQKGLPSTEKEVAQLQEKMNALQRIAMADGNRELSEDEIGKYYGV